MPSKKIVDKCVEFTFLCGENRQLLSNKKNQQLVVVGFYKQVDANVVLPYKIKSKPEKLLMLTEFDI
jgi:hypothetical protein